MAHCPICDEDHDDVSICGRCEDPQIAELEARVRLCHSLLEQAQPFLDVDNPTVDAISERICNELSEECPCPDESDWDKIQSDFAELEQELAAMTSRYSRAATDIATLEQQLAEARRERDEAYTLLDATWSGPLTNKMKKLREKIRAAIDDAREEE